MRGVVFILSLVLGVFLFVILASALIDKPIYHLGSSVRVSVSGVEKSLQDSIDDSSLMSGEKIGGSFSEYPFHNPSDIYLVSSDGREKSLKEAIDSGDFQINCRDVIGGTFSGKIRLGHSAESIFVEISGEQKSLQDAINDRDLCNKSECINEEVYLLTDGPDESHIAYVSDPVNCPGVNPENYLNRIDECFSVVSNGCSYDSCITFADDYLEKNGWAKESEWELLGGDGNYGMYKAEILIC